MQRNILLLITLFIAFSASAQQRIVTAGSSSSEIVCALGLCDNIVATDQTSQFPASLKALPSIGYRSGISAEGIIAQRPDLVIFERGYVKEELIKQLKSTGIKTLVIDFEPNFNNTKERIRTIASAINRSDEGEAIIRKIATDLKYVEQKIAVIPSRPKVLCVYARGQGNMQVAGKNSPFTLLELSGAQNAVPEIEGYKPLNAESLIKANPDYILFFTSGLASIGGLEEALKITGVQQTTAGKKRQIISMDGVLLTNWGPRVAEAALQLFELTHPEAGN
ncbi:MAG: heme/hemin ABC transporter substrate-binding protein [Candidatus Cyclobacteriaceae bacterium M2_1C_046]